jgi:hypothetical protein
MEREKKEAWRGERGADFRANFQTIRPVSNITSGEVILILASYGMLNITGVAISTL